MLMSLKWKSNPRLRNPIWKLPKLDYRALALTFLRMSFKI
jgi:hypothetical protein